MDAIPVTLSGADIRQVSVKCEGRYFGKVDNRLIPAVVEETELDPLRHFRK